MAQANDTAQPRHAQEAISFFHPTIAAIYCRRDIPGSTKLVAEIIGEEAGRVSINEIAKKIAVCRRTAKQGITKLVSLDILSGEDGAYWFTDRKGWRNA